MNPGRILAGLTFILIGVLLVLDRTGTVNAGDAAWQLWPLLLVAVGIGMYFSQGSTRTGALIVTGAGLLLLIASIDILPGDFGDWFWPVVLIGAGIWVISRRFWGDQPDSRGPTSDRLSSTVILSSNEIESRSTNFQGGTLTTVLGGTKLNLRRATMAPDGARLDITAVMGDSEVHVPEDWAVQVNASPILGDIKDETRGGTYQAGDPVLTIKATSIMADIKIKRVD